MLSMLLEGPCARHPFRIDMKRCALRIDATGVMRGDILSASAISLDLELGSTKNYIIATDMHSNSH
jgi:hypothetical protein